MIREIVGTKNTILRQKAKPVAKVDKKVLSLVKDLKDTLDIQKDPEGVGLAAPQIGKSVRIFVMKLGKDLKAIINPEIVSISKKLAPENNKIMEGCLSLPHYYGPLERAETVQIKYIGEDGKEKIETFQGFPAQIVQHEIDHLEGILFVDRLLEQKKTLYELTGDEWEEVQIV